MNKLERTMNTENPLQKTYCAPRVKMILIRAEQMFTASRDAVREDYNTFDLFE